MFHVFFNLLANKRLQKRPCFYFISTTQYRPVLINKLPVIKKPLKRTEAEALWNYPILQINKQPEYLESSPTTHFFSYRERARNSLNIFFYCNNNYVFFSIDTMRKLSWVIENEINYENTISFLKLQISDAIMHYQTNNVLINKKITDKCYTKTKSTTIPAKDQHQFKQRVVNRRNVKKPFKDNKRTHSKLKELFADLNTYFVSLAGVWNSFIPNICKSISVHNQKCWNQTHLHSYRFVPRYRLRVFGIWHLIFEIFVF